jgi:aminopeptidase N
VYKDGRIHFEQASLKTDEKNIVEIHFKNKYYTDTRGIHKYIDVDGSQFLQTSTEPFWGNRFVPYFDQPDLKGRFTLKAITPSEWELITSVNPSLRQSFEEYSSSAVSNGNIDQQISENYNSLSNKQDLTFWSFPKSALLPTYLFAFAAGPFAKIHLSSVELPETLKKALIVPRLNDKGRIEGKF